MPSKVGSQINYGKNIPTIELSVSSSTLTDCTAVVATLKQLGIMASVVTNTSIICNNTSCWTETGCNLIIPGVSRTDLRTKIWRPLSQQFGFTCAHLKIPNVYHGCILDYLAPSVCPGPTR